MSATVLRHRPRSQALRNKSLLRRCVVALAEKIAEASGGCGWWVEILSFLCIRLRRRGFIRPVNCRPTSCTRPTDKVLTIFVELIFKDLVYVVSLLIC